MAPSNILFRLVKKNGASLSKMQEKFVYSTTLVLIENLPYFWKQYE